MTPLIVSPHLDDAVLGCGQLLAGNPGGRIITVFAGVPTGELPLTNFDVNSGFTSAHQAMTERRREDVRACTVLDSSWDHLGFLDRQYGAVTDDQPIIDELTLTINETSYDQLFIPLGLVHPDHEQVARCARAAAEALDVQPIFYEELPARVLWPRIVCLTSIIDDLRPIRFTVGELYLKEAAIACYRSQAWALDRHACLVPESFWT